MDHLDFVVLFLSISVWFVAFGMALAARNTRADEVSRQYRSFSLPIALFVLLQMVAYYLENGAIAEWPLWFALLHSHISVTMLMLSSRTIILLAAAMSGRELSPATVRRLNVTWLAGYVVATALLELDAAYETGSALIDLPVIAAFLGGFGAAVAILLRRPRSRNTRLDSRILAGIFAVTIVVFIEDLVVSLVDEMIFYPYAFLTINLFFVRYFGRIVGETRLRESTPSNLARIVSAYDVSNREAEVLELLVRGTHRVEIGSALFISENTVKTHIANLYRKLGVTSRDELMKLISDGIDLGPAAPADGPPER